MNLDFSSKNSFFADTHCHLDFKEFQKDQDQVIKNAFSKSVKLIINVGTNIKSSKASVELAEKYPFIYSAVGIHPTEVENIKKEDFEVIEKLAQKNKVVAIGEIGLDFFRLKDKNIWEKQKELFLKQIKVAQKVDLPLIIHCRDAFSATIEILKKKKVKKAVFHCFSGQRKHLDSILKSGFFVSYTGVVTFKNSFLVQENLKTTPLSKLLLETDCPYLAPQSKRGQRAEPVDIIEITQKVAELKKISLKEVAHKTFQNTLDFFNI